MEFCSFCYHVTYFSGFGSNISKSSPPKLYLTACFGEFYVVSVQALDRRYLGYRLFKKNSCLMFVNHLSIIGRNNFYKVIRTVFYADLTIVTIFNVSKLY